MAAGGDWGDEQFMVMIWVFLNGGTESGALMCVFRVAFTV
jgi:hypothetical protein